MSLILANKLKLETRLKLRRLKLEEINEIKTRRNN